MREHSCPPCPLDYDLFSLPRAVLDLHFEACYKLHVLLLQPFMQQNPPEELLGNRGWETLFPSVIHFSLGMLKGFSHLHRRKVSSSKLCQSRKSTGAVQFLQRAGEEELLACERSCERFLEVFLDQERETDLGCIQERFLSASRGIGLGSMTRL